MSRWRHVTVKAVDYEGTEYETFMPTGRQGSTLWTAAHEAIRKVQLAGKGERRIETLTIIEPHYANHDA